MILTTILPNLLPWIEQITVIALVAALLPVLFQMRHPRTHLAYCHLMLIVCLLLPFLEPWRHPVVLVSGSTLDDAVVASAAPDAQPSAQPTSVGISRSVPLPPAPAPVPFWRKVPADSLLLWILGAGVLGRLSWLLVGLWHIRQYRIAATPLYPIPESVQAASALTHADALFCISSDVPGPVMLGVFRPIVLLPKSFLSLDDEAQCGIAAHELLHVQRKDWLVTLLEELTGALLWFNPAVWWLLSQTRLAREQVVDAEVVRLTSAREPYIHALLAIARARPTLDLAPAPLFLRRRHLTQRMHSLLKDVSVSGFRLLSSYASIAVVLALAGWLSFVSFPLVGDPQVQRIAANVQTAAADLPTSIVSAVPTPAAHPAAPASVPANGQEPVTGTIQVPATPAERAAALSLLERARQNSDLHIGGTPPFQLDATFLASGNVNYVGSGAVSETWITGKRWRWTANLADYSQARIGSGQSGFDEQPVSAVPMRVHMLREAIFWPLQFAANPRLRTASPRWNGNPVTCLLLGGELGSTVQSRLWTEQEYCIDNESGLLLVKSSAPGTYWMYGYGKNLQFHGRFLPDRLTAWVGGAPVLDAHITIADAGSVNADLLTPSAAMIAPGLGISLTLGPKFQIDAPGSYAPSSYANDAIQTVIVHAELAPAGNVLEEEVSASADPRLSQTALDLVKQHGFPPAGTQREVYVNVRFIPATQ